MTVNLAYGLSGLKVELPDTRALDIVEPSYPAALANPEGSLHDALRRPIGCAPLESMVKSGSRVGIVVSDITRATPYPLLLPPLLEHLTGAGEIIFFVATGTHRANTESELRDMLGDTVVDGYRVVQNDCQDRHTHRRVGTTNSGNDIWILDEYLSCDLRIPTGFIEPHFFAGFSGGGKAIMPGLALLETILRNHRGMHMDHPRARWGITEGNPLWEEVREAALMSAPSFLLNVTLNREQELTGVFAGDFVAAHAAGCEAAKLSAMTPVDDPYDIVVTTNSGAPLDLNLYQSVKGMSAAAQIVKPGGHIIAVAECWDGIPDHGTFGSLLRDSPSPEALLEQVRRPGSSVQDQWQAHILALIVANATVHFHTANLSDDQLRDAFLVPCADVSKRLADLLAELGPDARVCVLPEGPQTIPYLRGVQR